MGVVYLVEHVHTGQELALKVLSLSAGLTASSVERFKREARAPARIKSENVVTVTDADVLPELGGMPFFVMERLCGRDLEAEVVARGRLPGREVIELLRQAAGALDRSHALGIVHRDLKPENFFLHRRDNGSVCLKILDFGISKTFEDGRGGKAASLTGPGSLIGTPLYMSPEQASDGGPVTPATDVWSLGLVVVRLLTGDTYWNASSVPELLAALLRDPLYPPSSRWRWLSHEFDIWFARSCNRDPQSRFASVGAQVDELARVLDHPAEPRAGGSTHPRVSEMPAVRAITPPSLRRTWSRTRTTALAAGAVAIAVAVLGLVAPRMIAARRSASGIVPAAIRADASPVIPSEPLQPAVRDANTPSSTRPSAPPGAPLPTASQSTSASATASPMRPERARPSPRQPRSEPPAGFTHDPVAP